MMIGANATRPSGRTTQPARNTRPPAAITRKPGRNIFNFIQWSFCSMTLESQWGHERINTMGWTPHGSEGESEVNGWLKKIRQKVSSRPFRRGDRHTLKEYQACTDRFGGVTRVSFFLSYAANVFAILAKIVIKRFNRWIGIFQNSDCHPHGRHHGTEQKTQNPNKPIIKLNLTNHKTNTQLHQTSQSK